MLPVWHGEDGTGWAWTNQALRVPLSQTCTTVVVAVLVTGDSRAGDPGACHGHPGRVCLACANSPGAGPCHTTHSYPSWHGMAWNSSLPLAQPQKCQPKVIDCPFGLCLRRSLLHPCRGKAQRWLCAPVTAVPSGHGVFPAAPSCHRASPRPWSTLAAVRDREQGHVPAGTAGPQGTPGAGRLHRCRGRRAATWGVPRARPELAKPARPAPGQPCGCRRLPRARPGAMAGHREQGRERDAPRLGTASQRALCSRGWKQVAVTSCCQPVGPGCDSEGCHLGSSPAPCTPQHRRCPPIASWPDPAPHFPRTGFGVCTSGGTGSSPTSIGVLCPWGPPAQHPPSLAG